MRIKRCALGALAMALLNAVAGPAFAGSVELNGAGATFPFPIYSKWFDEYHAAHPDVKINYQSIGSGGGIQQVTKHTVDFGASDGPMTDEQMRNVKKEAGLEVQHVPTVLGAVVPVFNVPGVGALNLTGKALAGIYLGKITKWNDPEIAKANPGVGLPGDAITVIHRSDGSGTTYCFTDYLSKASPEWKAQVGKGTSVNWPAGLGAKGNEGVSGLVKQTPDSIGYVELIYAIHNDIAYASVRNRAGKYVKADLDSVTQAAAGAAKHMPKDYRVSITDAPGAKSYPISTFTWLLIYKKNPDQKGAVLKDFLRWMLRDGEPMTQGLGYAPLPAQVAQMVGKTIESIR